MMTAGYAIAPSLPDEVLRAQALDHAVNLAIEDEPTEDTIARAEALYSFLTKGRPPLSRAVSLSVNELN